MYPGGNNMPYQPNTMGQSMGFNVPPTPGMMPPNMGVPPAYPPNMAYHPGSIPPQSPGYGAAHQNYNPVTYTPTTVFGNAGGGQLYTDPNSGPVSPYQGQYETQSLSVNTTTPMASNSRIPGQKKDSVDKMAIDFLKQFQEGSDYGACKTTIPSKASKIREGSPFSDVSDTHCGASGSGPNHVRPSESPQLKGILHKYQDSHSVSSTGRLSRAPNVSSSQQRPDNQGPHTSSSISSIMENYLSETSHSKEKIRVTSSSRSSDNKDMGKHSQPYSTDKSSGKDYRDGGRATEKYRKDKISSHRRDSHKDESLQDVLDDDPDPDPNFAQSQVYIGNLPEDITERDLHEYLKNYRAEIWIGYNKSNREDICAFVKLPTMQDSKKMMSDKRADIFKGKKLDVRFTAARDFTDNHIQLHPPGRQSDLPRRKRSFSPRKSRRSRSPRGSRRSRSPRGSRRSRSPRGHSPRGSRRSRSPRGSRRSRSPRGSRRSRSPKRSRSPMGARGSVTPRRNRRSFSPQKDMCSDSPRGDRIDPSGQQQLYYSQEAPFMSNLDQGIQFIPNPGDQYGVPVYIMPQPIPASQQVFIPSYDFPQPMEIQGPIPSHMMASYENQQPVYSVYGNYPDNYNRGGGHDGSIALNWREKEREAEKERQSKTLFMGYVDSAFANAPLLGKKYITEYLCTRDSRAVYVCSVCMEMCYDSGVADHVVGYRHRLKCFRKDQPEIYDKLCRIRDKSTMIMECARMAADNEIAHEKITIQMCTDPDERGQKHLENIKDASYIGRNKSKAKDQDQVKVSKESNSMSSGLDIFKRIAMYKQKIEDTKKEDRCMDEGKGDDDQKMTSNTLSKNRSLADSIVAEIKSKQQNEEASKVAEETEKEKEREEEKKNKLLEEKRKEEEMNKRLEEARQRVIENQKKVEEARLRKIEEEKQKKIEEEKRLKEEEEKQKLKVEEERIKEEKRKLAEQRRKLNLEKKLLEQQKIDEAKKQALALAKKREEEMQAEEKRKEEAQRQEEAKRKEEEQKVELMLQMLEDQKLAEEAQKLEEQKRQEKIRHDENLERQMEENHLQSLKQEEMALQQASEEKQLSMKMTGYQSQTAMQSLKKNQERMVEEIKNRHAHLKLLQETENQRKKEEMATQKRAAALKRIEEMKKAKDAGTQETSSTVTEPFPVIYDSKYCETHEHELTPEQKLVHLRKRAYLNLKYSLDEKRMHLRTNIGLEDKIGPDPNSKIDSVLALKFNLKGAGNPLIGLQYVVEGFEGKDDRHIHRYYCEICGVETFHCDGLLQHIIGFGHRAKYLEIHKPDVYDNLMQQDYRRATLSELIKQEAIKIEKESGRHQIPTLTMYEFRTYALKMKQVETGYRNPVATMSDVAMNIKQMIRQSEKEMIASKDEGPIDTTINIQGFINKTLAMACEISFKEGSSWVDFYIYIQKQRLTKNPMLGLQFVTEVRGNRRYAPKFTCSLCDIVALSCSQDIYSHLHTAQHLEKYLNLVHPERILGNIKLSSKTLTKPEHDKIICDIAHEIEPLQKERKNIKVGVLLVENIWKIWHERCKQDYEQHQSGEREEQQQSTEREELSGTGVLKLRPQLYDIIRKSAVPICGLGYLTEIQNDTGQTTYVCNLCNNSNLNQKTILDHLRARNHCRLYMVRKGFDANLTVSGMNHFLRAHPDREAITVKKLLYLDVQGHNVYSVQEVIKDPGPQKPDEENKFLLNKSTSNVTQNMTKGTESSIHKVVSGTNVAKQAEQSPLIGTWPTRFDKIVKGLDYTPLLGIEFMTEVQSSSGKFTPIYECDLCNQRGKLSQLCPKNILRHLGTKGHRLAYLQRKHPAAFKDIKSVLDKHERAKKLDHHTKEIASKFGRQEIQIRVETDPLYFDSKNFEPDSDDVIITKIEMKQTEAAKGYQSVPTVKQSATTSPDVPKHPTNTSEDLPDFLPKDPAVNLDQYINKKDYDADRWQQENDWIQENMENGQLVPSSRCSKFVASYNSSFSTYPIIGLQWITEIHKPNGVLWCVCRLCEETINKWKFLNNHVSSLKHRLRYIEKKYPPIYLALKREQFTVRNESLLRARVYKHSQDIMKTEGQEFKPEVMIQNCQKILPPVRSNKISTKESVKTISTISVKKPRSDSKYNPQKVKSQSANITVITTGNNPYSWVKESTPQKRNITGTSSNSAPKRLKIDPGDAGLETKDEAPNPIATVFDKPIADNMLQTEEETGIGGDETMSNEGSIRETTVMKTDEAAIQPIYRSKEIVDFRGLKRKAVEEIEIQTKTPSLKPVLDDISDDEITMKKSKVDYKHRGYRDSYGSSYGQAQETKGRSSSRSSGSRHSSSSYQRQNKRESDRNRDYRKPSSKDRTDKYQSSPRQRNTHVEMKQEVKKAEVVNEKEVECDEGQGDDEDFDAFIMAQLGEDFVTVDELEEVRDVENVDQVEREESLNEQPREKDGGQAIELQLSGDSEIVKEQNITIDKELKRQPLDNVSISAASAEGENNVKVPSQVNMDTEMDSQNVNCAKMDQIEVSVELAEQKTPEKSVKSVKRDAVPISGGPLRFTNLQVEVEIDGESKTDVRDISAKQENVELRCESNTDAPSGKQKSYSLKDFTVFNPKTISAQSSVYLGIPISSSTRGSDDKSPMAEIKEIHKSDSSVISLPSNDKTENESNDRETIGTSAKVNKGRLADEKNAEQTLVAMGRAQRLDSLNPSYKDDSDETSIVFEIGESNKTSEKTVANIQNELTCGSHGLVTVHMTESHSQEQKNEPSKGKGEIVADEKDPKSVKTGNTKTSRNDSQTTKSNEGIEKCNEALFEGVITESVKKAAFKVRPETTDNDKVTSLDDPCSDKPDTTEQKGKGTLKIKDKEMTSFSKTEKGKGDSFKKYFSNKRPIQSSVKSWTKCSSPSMRQTRSSKVTMITMEVDDTSSEHSKTDSSVKDGKTANECEISIEIG